MPFVIESEEIERDGRFVQTPPVSGTLLAERRWPVFAARAKAAWARLMRWAGSGPCEATGVANRAILRAKSLHAGSLLEPDRRETAATGKGPKMSRIDFSIRPRATTQRAGGVDLLRLTSTREGWPNGMLESLSLACTTLVVAVTARPGLGPDAFAARSRRGACGALQPVRDLQRATEPLHAGYAGTAESAGRLCGETSFGLVCRQRDGSCTPPPHS